MQRSRERDLISDIVSERELSILLSSIGAWCGLLRKQLSEPGGCNQELEV